MEKEQEPTDIEPNLWQELWKAMRKDWHIYPLCIVTIIICYSFYANVQGNLDTAMGQCNDHWIKQVKAKCPTFYAIDNTPKFNLTMEEIENGELTTN